MGKNKSCLLLPVRIAFYDTSTALRQLCCVHMETYLEWRGWTSSVLSVALYLKGGLTLAAAITEESSRQKDLHRCKSCFRGTTERLFK